jgi:hypothetical protein
MLRYYSYIYLENHNNQNSLNLVEPTKIRSVALPYIQTNMPGTIIFIPIGVSIEVNIRTTMSKQYNNVSN